MFNFTIIDLKPQMTAEAAQAAALLQRVFAPQGSWVTLAEAEQEVAEMLVPDRIVRVALAEGQVIGWIGGIPGWLRRNGRDRAWARRWWRISRRWCWQKAV